MRVVSIFSCNSLSVVRHSTWSRAVNVWCYEFMGNVASLPQAGTSHLAWHKDRKEPRALSGGVSSTHISTQNGAPRGVNTCSQRPLGEWRWFGDCVQGSGGAWERECTMGSHKTDRRGGGEVIIEGGRLKSCCVRQPDILRNLSVVERCFCCWVVRCGRL